MKTQKRTACISCPWRTKRDGSYFGVKVLKQTVVKDHLCDRIHPCHGDGKHFCAGYLAFLKAQPDGMEGHALARMAIGLGLIDVDLISDISVFATIKDMLTDHQETINFLNKAIDGWFDRIKRS